MREGVYGALAFHIYATFSHLCDNSLISRPSPPPTVACKTTGGKHLGKRLRRIGGECLGKRLRRIGGERLGKRLCRIYEMYASARGAIKLGYVLILGSLYTLCVITVE